MVSQLQAGWTLCADPHGTPVDFPQQLGAELAACQIADVMVGSWWRCRSP
jgi:hypothetical protein